jgi:hypothetical protein
MPRLARLIFAFVLVLLARSRCRPTPAVTRSRPTTATWWRISI